MKFVHAVLIDVTFSLHRKFVMMIRQNLKGFLLFTENRHVNLEPQ